jgi:hypothetical protein
MKPIYFGHEKHGVSLLQIRPLSHRKGNESRIASNKRSTHRPCCVHAYSIPATDDLSMYMHTLSKLEQRQSLSPSNAKSGSPPVVNSFRKTYTKTFILPIGHTLPARSCTMGHAENWATLTASSEPCVTLTESSNIQQFVKKSFDNKLFQAFAISPEMFTPILTSGEEAIK